MKANDVIGLTATFAAGYYVANQMQAATIGPTGWQWYDFAIVIGLLAVGFYFAVVLS